MQVAFSTVFGPLKDHPSQATPRRRARTCSASSRCATSRTSRAPSCSTVRCFRSGCRGTSTTATTTSSTAPVCCAPVEVPPEGGLTGFVDGIALYDAISPELRDQIEGETVIYAMDVIMDNLRFGRPEGFVEVEAGEQAIAVMTEFEGRPRASTLRSGLASQGRRSCTYHRGWRRASRVARIPTATRCSPRCATRSSRRPRTSATSTVGSRPTWSSGTTGVACTRVSGMAPEHARCMHRTTIAGDYGLGRFEAEVAVGDLHERKVVQYVRRGAPVAFLSRSARASW